MEVRAKRTVHASTGRGVYERMLRVCRFCKIELPLSSFGKSSRNRDGLQTICKPCDVAAVQASRKRKLENQSVPKGWQRRAEKEKLEILNRQFEKSKVSLGKRELEQEAAAIDELELRMPGWELRRWQDSTKSDLGVRRKRSQIDLWLPLQIKSNSNGKRAFHLKGSDGMLPICDLLCITMEPFSMLFVPREAIDDLDVPTCGVWYTKNERCTQWEVDPQALHAIFLKRCCEDDLVLTERMLRMQVNSKYTVEMLNIEFANRLLPNTKVEWPTSTNGVVDLIRDGEREQHKSVLRDANCFTARHCWKKMCGVQVAYELGDNDWYVFGHLRKDYFVQWRIPEAAMDEHGILSRRSESGESFVHAGNTTLQLCILDESGGNMDAQMRIVGKVPNRDADRWTGKYVSVLWL